jgi:hypothetical protein
MRYSDYKLENFFAGLFLFCAIAIVLMQWFRP